ncbi:VWA domain-containing protein [Microbacterium sp. P05]|uniref:VWA domain-containing protein n=1 Tax=Microbacterium sp. P05 TaxID=3366948 RepID=UPI003745B59B
MRILGGRRRSPQPQPLDPSARIAWEAAQRLWGVRMADAQLLPGAGREVGSFAWFSFPPTVAIDPALVAERGVAGELESVFAHELGHHVLAPSTRIDGLKIRHQMARALTASGARAVNADHAATLANMWNDLLVNTRLALLQRRAAAGAAAASAPLTEPGIVRTLRITTRSGYDSADRLWWVYRRTYELVWNLVPGAFCPPVPPPAPPPLGAAPVVETPLSNFAPKFREQELALRAARREAALAAAELNAAITSHPQLDADLAAGLVRTFLADPVSGALRFGMLAAPYLVEGERAAAADLGRAGSLMGRACAADDAPATAKELGQVLADGRLHGAVAAPDGRAGDADEPGTEAPGQGFGVAETLALYEASDADAVMAAYYRTEAAPWVRPFTQRRPALPDASLPGPLAVWELGDDLADIDWPASFRTSAVLVPGVTTRRRTWLADEPVAAEESIELDLYIDSSGSMPAPRRGSPAVLAGSILALSVLRGGGRVRVTSFSGPAQVAGSERFTRDHVEIVRGLTTFFAGGTSFPLDLYGQRYAGLAVADEATRRHVVVLSDDGLRSMFGFGNEPFSGTAATVRAALTTGTLVLLDAGRQVADAAEGAGYDVLYLQTMDDAPAACARLAEVLHG